MARLVRAALMEFIQPVQLLSIDADKASGAVTGRFRSGEMVFDYQIKGEQVVYGPIGGSRSDADGDWERRSRGYLMTRLGMSSSRLDGFLAADARMDARARKRCGTGYNCGGTCISRAKDCKLLAAGSQAIKRLAALMGIEDGSPKVAMLVDQRQRPVAITAANVRAYAGEADVTPLQGKSPQELAAAFKIPPGFFQQSSAALVPLHKLVVPKDERKDPAYQAGLKADPRTTAAKIMGESIAKAGDPSRERREPIKVSDNGDGTYTVVDGNATVQALMLAGAKGFNLPVQVVAFKGYDSQLVRDKEPGERHTEGARQLAAGVRKRGEQDAQKVTARVLDMADQFGYTPEGLAYRLKTRDSIASKIDRDTNEIIDNSGGKLSFAEAQQQAAAGMGDVIRFTFLANEGYTTKLKGLISELESTGHNVRAKNSWVEGQAFRGMNMAVTGPGGEKFEIQVHSNESKKLAQRSHALYNVYRESKDDDQRRKLHDQMIRFASEMRAPYDMMTPDGGLGHQPQRAEAVTAGGQDGVQGLPDHGGGFPWGAVAERPEVHHPQPTAGTGDPPPAPLGVTIQNPARFDRMQVTRGTGTVNQGGPNATEI